MDTNTSEIFPLVWGQPVDEMKKKLKLQPKLAIEKEKMEVFSQAENVMKISEILFCVILRLKKNSSWEKKKSWWKKAKTDSFLLKL